MAIYVTFTVGVVFWIVAWAFGIKAFDAFLVTMLMTITAAAIKIYKPFLDQLLGRESAPKPDQGPF